MRGDLRRNNVIRAVPAELASGHAITSMDAPPCRLVDDTVRLGDNCVQVGCKQFAQKLHRNALPRN
jgi:hypothetical protein